MESLLELSICGVQSYLSEIRQLRGCVINIDIFNIIVVDCTDVTCADFLQQNVVDADADKVTVSVFNVAGTYQLLNTHILSNLCSEKTV